MNYIQNKTLLALLKLIENNGFEAYVVGGYIRNQLLGFSSYDFDIATNAKVDDLEIIFDDFICNKQFTKFLRVDVLMDDIWFQITSFRSDANYKNHRYPSKINYALNLKQDSYRRDFTINAIYCDSDNNLFDYHNGLNDLNNKCIKTIIDADVSFNDDALRILRALRLMSQYDLNIDNQTQDIMIKYFDLLLSLKNTRKYQEELDKLKSGKYYFALNNKLDNILVNLIGQL